VSVLLASSGIPYDIKAPSRPAGLKVARERAAYALARAAPNRRVIPLPLSIELEGSQDGLSSPPPSSRSRTAMRRWGSTIPLSYLCPLTREATGATSRR